MTTPPYGPQPFFAMEMVDGRPLLEYSSKKNLGLRERLTLMVHICEAVEHAHQRGVIHRDLKPGNILVEDSGQPKILDFGLARITDSDVQTTRETNVGQILGTLPYMSPEQVLADPLALDTRSDVYALGVILYELLAGKLPYELSQHLPEAVRTIQEVDPAPLSSINRTCRGDVETIVAKALEKDKERRYGSAAGLAADIRRYLEDRPITAKPASTAYQLKKFARRNKALVAGVAAVFLVLVAGLAISSYEAVRARRAELRAQTEAATSKAVVDFLQNDMLSQAGSTAQASGGLKPDPDIKVRTALDRAAQNIGGKFSQQPEVEASIRSTIGQAYMDMGVYPQAQTQFERALDLDRTVMGKEDPKTLRLMSSLGRLESLQAKNQQAEALLSQAFETQRRVLGPEHPDTLHTANWLANIYENEARYAQAEALHSNVLEIRRRLLGAEHPDMLTVMNNLGIDYQREAKYAQAEAILSQALEIRRRVSGPDHPDTLKPLINLSNVYFAEGKYAQAEQLQIQALEIQRRVLGPEHPLTVSTMQGLANTYGSEGKSAQALALQEESLKILQRVLGPEHPDTLRTMSALAGEYGRAGDTAKAEQLFSQTLEIQRRVLAPDHPDTVKTAINLGIAKSRLGNYAGADRIFNQWLEAARRVQGPEDPRTLNMLSIIAAIFQSGGKYGLAEKYAAQLLTGRRHALGDQSPDTMVAAANLALAYVLQKKFAEAEPLAREVMQTDSKIQPDHWQRFRALSLLGASLAGQGKYAEAKPLLVEGYRGMLSRGGSMTDWERQNIELAHQWLDKSNKDSGEGTVADR